MKHYTIEKDSLKGSQYNTSIILCLKLNEFSITTLFLQVFIENVDTQAVADALQVGHIFGQGIDSLCLFFEIFFFQEICQVRIIMVASHSV